jgi:hypothetical protein
MATSIAHTHTHRAVGVELISERPATQKGAVRPNAVKTFFADLLEDIRQKPLQDAKFAKHDMFREHIHAMSISYFSLIVLLIAGSIFLLPALIPILTQ